MYEINIAIKIKFYFVIYATITKHVTAYMQVQ